MNNCSKCNKSYKLKSDCDLCCKKPVQCHPCYNIAVGDRQVKSTCCDSELEAQPISNCYNPSYCCEGCAEKIEEKCIIPSLKPLTITRCVGDGYTTQDAIVDFKELNNVDIGVSTFLTTYTGYNNNRPGVYFFKYESFNPYLTQLITISISDCELDDVDTGTM